MRFISLRPYLFAIQFTWNLRLLNWMWNIRGWFQQKDVMQKISNKIWFSLPAFYEQIIGVDEWLISKLGFTPPAKIHPCIGVEMACRLVDAASWVRYQIKKTLADSAHHRTTVLWLYKLAGIYDPTQEVKPPGQSRHRSFRLIKERLSRKMGGILHMYFLVWKMSYFFKTLSNILDEFNEMGDR